MKQALRRTGVAVASIALVTSGLVVLPAAPALAEYDGSAFAWGGDDSGQLGNGSTTGDQYLSVAIPSLASRRVTAVSAGWDHSCAVAQGKAWCWGDNAQGELGRGTTGAPVVSPVEVTGLTGLTVTAVSAGFNATCAIASGKAYCWGADTSERLGNGAASSSSTPVLVQAANGSPFNSATVTAIDVGDQHVCAVASGRVYCWGDNDEGQLGNGDVVLKKTEDRPVPVLGGATDLTSRTATDVTASSGLASHTCAVADAAVFCWGANDDGQRGVGVVGLDAFLPARVAGELDARTATVVDAGLLSTCAVADGRAYCWGSNGAQQLGLGAGGGSFRSEPAAVSQDGGMTGTVVDVSVGAYHACALERYGSASRAWCWGMESDGRLGTGNPPSDPSLPKLVLGAAVATRLRSVSAGSIHTLAAEASTPGAPGSLAVAAGDGSLTATWTPPTDDGGSPVTSYRVSLDVGGTASVVCTVPVPTTTCTVPGLDNGTTYTLAVRAVNAVSPNGGVPVSGTGAPQAPPAGTPPSTDGSGGTGGTVGTGGTGGTGALAPAATTVSGWSTKRLRLGRGETAKVRVRVAPAAVRTVAVQVRTAKGRPWKTTATRTTTSTGRATVRIKGAATTRWWRLSVPATTTAAAVTTKARTVKPR